MQKEINHLVCIYSFLDKKMQKEIATVEAIFRNHFFSLSTLEITANSLVLWAEIKQNTPSSLQSFNLRPSFGFRINICLVWNGIR